MRCFVALDLPDEVKATLRLAQAAIGDGAPQADLRWTSAAGLHVTLQFLGEVPEETAPAVADALARAAAGCAPLALHAVGVGAFPTPVRPRVIWAGIAGAGAELAHLAAAVGSILTPLGYPPEARPFRAHVTLGRVRRPVALGRLAAAIAAVGPARFGAWTATEVVLYRSHLGPRGSTYEALARPPLSSPCP